MERENIDDKNKKTVGPVALNEILKNQYSMKPYKLLEKFKEQCKPKENLNQSKRDFCWAKQTDNETP